MSGFTSIKVDSEFAEQVRQDAAAAHRSIAGQLMYWAKIGKAFDEAVPVAKARLAAAVEGTLDADTFSPQEVSEFEALLSGESKELAEIEAGQGDYSYPKVVLYEVLRDLVTKLVAFRSEDIASEEARPIPNAAVIARLDDEVFELRRELSQVQVDDLGAIVSLIQRYQLEIEQREANAVKHV